MPTPIGSTEGARNAVIANIVAGLETESEKIVAIRELDERLDAMQVPVEIPRLVERGWLRFEDIDDIVDAVENNLTYIATLADLLRASSYLASILVDTRARAADIAAADASNFVNDLRVYLSARKGGGDAIMVTPADLSGDFSVVGRSILPKATSTSNVSVSVKKVVTNGIAGNMFELTGDVEADVPLTEITFSDPSGNRAMTDNAFDDKMESIFEIESIRVLDDDWIETEVNTWSGGRVAKINWNKAPADGKLVAEIEAKVLGAKITSLVIVPDLSLTEKILVEAVEFSKDDGKKWYKAKGPVAISTGTGAYDGGVAGEGTWTIPGGRANRIKVRVAQDTPYRTKVATVDFTAAGTDTPLVAGPALSDLAVKRQYFVPASGMLYGAANLDKKVIAREADRWAIAIKEIDARACEYERSAVFVTKTYELPADCDRLGLSAIESIPSGTTITYEISHNGVNWNKISPIQRSSGKEIMVFAAGGQANPNTDPGAIYVQTETPVREITLRISMTSKGVDAPSVSDLSIHPVLKRL